MSLLPFVHTGSFGDPFEDLHREMRRFERAMVPYWRSANITNLNAATDVGQIVNDDKTFGVRMDVSHFRPEQLKVNLDNRMLTIEGEQEDKSEHGYSKRSFTRKFLLPEDVDVTAVKSHLSEQGVLSIEGPKKAVSAGRAIPIETGKKHEAIKHK
ncbi:hypothetical protein WR25_23430 isoform B [Diploscapter pachys]|uniref:SHSP domain-containing protein n=1 Tax=Diploscapter pachys TaxID=2018661 RepID=A0A2A2JM37_9BILA|nr:hypothetical protein WR25_23430 isoform A [Diploscapter pachys]PAV62801.1 hypothetical protein WR25_23430 isoform B [Diploscapter pachys]